jgi:hypothetical protein
VRRLFAFHAIIAAGALTACATITSGVVVAKDYKAAYTYTYYVNQCYSYDASMNCTLNIPTPQNEPEPECYELALKNANKTGSVCVDQATWKNTNVGDHFSGS